jgi:hypothetical protein
MPCVGNVLAGPTAQFTHLSGSSLILWDGADVELPFLFYYGSSLVNMSNIASVTLTATDNVKNDGIPVLPERTITFDPLPGFPGAVLDASATATDFAAGTKQHALFPYTAQEMNILAAAESDKDLWVVLTALTTTGSTWILCYAVVKVRDSRRTVAGAAVVNNPTYLTADQTAALIAAQPKQLQSVPVWNAEQQRFVEYISVGAAGQESLAPQSGGA